MNKQLKYELPKMIKLSSALLCLDCEFIFSRKKNIIDFSNNFCPACGSKTSVLISNFLDKKREIN